MKCAFFCHRPAFLFRPRVFSHALGCGARRGAACTPRRECGSRPGSVTRALGVQSRAIWQAITGSLSAELEPRRTMEPPYNLVFLLGCCCITSVSHRLSSAQPLCFVAATVTSAVAQQALPFVTATDDSSVYACVMFLVQSCPTGR